MKEPTMVKIFPEQREVDFRSQPKNVSNEAIKQEGAENVLDNIGGAQEADCRDNELLRALQAENIAQTRQDGIVVVGANDQPQDRKDEPDSKELQRARNHHAADQIGSRYPIPRLYERNHLRNNVVKPAPIAERLSSCNAIHSRIPNMSFSGE
jgi:hypothetical protein